MKNIIDKLLEKNLIGFFDKDKKEIHSLNISGPRSNNLQEILLIILERMNEYEKLQGYNNGATFSDEVIKKGLEYGKDDLVI